jgi:sugar phosphate permease
MDGNRRRWRILALGMAAQAASCVFLYGLPYLLPALRRGFHLSLGDASTLISCPLIGIVLALIAWGAAADRYGERLVITSGLVIAAGALTAAAFVRSVVPFGVALAFAGVGGASVNAASGRLVMGWFGPRERGLAMGARQTAQPLGTMLAAVLLPAVAAAGVGTGAGGTTGIAAAMFTCAALCLATAVAVAFFTSDPPRPKRADGAPRAANPYRAPVLWRIHGASTLLVVPQFVVTGFALEYLVTQRGWAVLTAGRVIAVANFAGALTRVAAGLWSDRVASRLRPMRQLAIAIAVIVALTAAGAAMRDARGDVALLTAAALSVSTNGLAFTAVAELSGMSWAGRALGVQNTAQNIAAAVTPPVVAQLIGGAGYAAAFGVTALFPLAAAFTIPVAADPRAPRPPAGPPRRSRRPSNPPELPSFSGL